jgi:kynurenine formamidase
MEKVIDLTHTIKDNMPVYPGDEYTRVYKTQTLEQNGYNNHRLEMSMHTGTHIDTSMHLLQSSRYISDIPLEALIGRGCVLDVRGEENITMKEVYLDKVQEGDIVLLHTGFDSKYGEEQYYINHPTIDKELVYFFIKRRIKVLGMDLPSPDRYPFEMHKLLLEKDILIIENLTNINKLIDEIDYEVFALPIKIMSDGASARVIARIRKR